MLLTTQKDTSFYPAATLETANLATEKLYYGGLDTGRVNKSTVSGYPTDTHSSPNDFIQKLNGSGQKVGANMLLKVMAGDKFNILVKSWYKKNGATPGTPVNPLTSILSLLEPSIIGAGVGAHGGITLPQLQSSNILDPGITSFLSSQSGYTTSKPKAFLNWILFDEQFKMVANSSGFEQVGADNVLTTHTQTNLSIAKNGFLYIYLSNETPNIDVFFDNLTVSHIRGPILEETHYYPFGLTMAGISSKALAFGNPQNKAKFNGIELNSDFDLNMYDAFYRNLDPQIGRFWQIDPKPNETFSSYAAMANNPILFNDILGDTARGVNTTSAQRALDAAKEAFNGIEGGDAVTALFRLADDGVSFANIDKDAFAAAYDGLGSDEAKALAAGYYNLINSSETQFIAMLKDGESLDLSGAQGMTKDFKSLVSKMGIKEGSSAADATGGGGQTVYSKNDGQGLSVISMNPTKKIDAVVTGINGKKSNVSYIPSVSFIFTHEVIGHGLAGQAFKTIPNYYDRAQANYGASVQVNNVYYKAHGMNYYDNGSGHMPLTPSNQRQPMETNRTIGIPSFLKFIR